MKRKIFNILVALALVVGLSLIAAVAMGVVAVLLLLAFFKKRLPGLA